MIDSRIMWKATAVARTRHSRFSQAASATVGVKPSSQSIEKWPFFFYSSLKNSLSRATKICYIIIIIIIIIIHPHWKKKKKKKKKSSSPTRPRGLNQSNVFPANKLFFFLLTQWLYSTGPRTKSNRMHHFIALKMITF